MMSKSEFFTTRQVSDRYGVSAMALKRWLADTDLAFPRPIEIKRRRYFLKSEILAWEETRRERTA